MEKCVIMEIAVLKLSLGEVICQFYDSILRFIASLSWRCKTKFATKKAAADLPKCQLEYNYPFNISLAVIIYLKLSSVNTQVRTCTIYSYQVRLMKQSLSNVFRHVSLGSNCLSLLLYDNGEQRNYILVIIKNTL